MAIVAANGTARSRRSSTRPAKTPPGAGDVQEAVVGDGPWESHGDSFTPPVRD